jgi:alpha-galactosidase
VDYPLLAIKSLIFSAILIAPSVCYALFSMPTDVEQLPQRGQIVALHVDHEIHLDAQHPAPEWKLAAAVSFDQDWQGKKHDPQLETKVRVLWSAANLYLRFDCQYREIYVFDDSDPNGRRNELWDRDVAEVFLQPDPSRLHFYREFEVAPNGMWIDLDIFPGGLSDLKSGMRRSVWLDKSSHHWTAELAIPMRALTEHFDPHAIWRVNFYRVEGRDPRKFLAWQPTGTPEPNFHVPEAFGTLIFQKH